MNIRQMLIKGHSKAITDAIVHYVGRDPKRFNILIINFLKGPSLITQRAAWPLSYCVENHPVLFRPHLGAVLKFLNQAGNHNGVKRNVMRLLQFVNIPKYYQSRVVEVGFRLMEPSEPIAVRVFAMTVLANIAQQQPALKNELQLIIEDQLPYGSAGYQSRAKKVLKELKK